MTKSILPYDPHLHEIINLNRLKPLKRDYGTVVFSIEPEKLVGLSTPSAICSKHQIRASLFQPEADVIRYQ